MRDYTCFSCLVLLLSLLYHYHFGKPISIIESPESHYDYIVVGAGTAGCVIASRLSEMSGVTVLLVEAGGYFDWLSSVPLAAPFMQGGHGDWAYKTEPQAFSSRGLHNHVYKGALFRIRQTMLVGVVGERKPMAKPILGKGATFIGRRSLPTPTSIVGRVRSSAPARIYMKNQDHLVFLQDLKITNYRGDGLCDGPFVFIGIYDLGPLVPPSGKIYPLGKRLTRYSDWQTQSWPRGKGLGGSGQLNYLVHSFGIPEDYANWPKGWTHEDLQPYFKKVESTMNVAHISPQEELAAAFSKVDQEVLDENVVIELARSTLKNGARWTSYHAYLQPALNRKNLHVLINTVVTKILLEDDSARGVEIKHMDGSHENFGARKEIIICGGAVNTPQLLMISGIGPVEELEKHRIPIVKDLEYVGKNLYDHLNVPIYVNLREPVSVTLSKIQSVKEAFKYFVLGHGLLANNAIMGTGRIDESGIVLFGMGTADEALLKDIANFRTKTFRALFPSYANSSHEGFIHLASCLQPKSRGYITLTSRNVSDPPKIDPKYLQDDFDVACTWKAMKFALRTLNTKQFHDIGATVHVPDLEECRKWKQDFENQEYAECVMRSGGLTGHHAGGTCRMGTNDDAVVDEMLRVRGVNGLRIMDASILPSPISGTPNSVIIAMADRAADLILNKTKT